MLPDPQSGWVDGDSNSLWRRIDLLQFEDHFSETVQAYNSHSTGSKDLHYLKYDTKKKAKSKPPKHTEGNPQPKSTPANSGRTCYRCKAPYTRGHEKICKALKAKCGYCQEIGHYEKCCRKAGNFPKKQVHIASAVPTPTLTPAPPAPSAPAQVPQEYWDEDGKLYREVHMLSAPSKKDLLIQFDIGKEIDSVNSQGHSKDRHWCRCEFPKQEYIQKLVPTSTTPTLQCHSEELQCHQHKASRPVQVLSTLERQVLLHNYGSYGQ